MTIFPDAASRFVAARRARQRPLVLLALALLAASQALLSGCGDRSAAPAPSPADRRLIEADRDGANWLSHGRTYDEQRHSPLTAISVDTVSRLGLGWYRDLGTRRGQEATPLEVDGTLYISLAWNIIEALDARTGRLLWRYDPKVPRDTLVKACCDAVSRGVAYWNGRIFAATLDGRLIALDAHSGKPLWKAVTTDPKANYTITGAPRVVAGKVVIGNGGAELGVRGYVSAYDATTGRLAWRFYTVPGNPAEPEPDPALRRAAATWSGQWWKDGGGGTAWDAIVYDPKLDLLYIGTGNGAPWPRKWRSPGGGDNLYLSSIVALRPETGRYVWHYQVNPGDDWDYTATQPLILADLRIGGRTRHVIMQAPKNGFFYVIDRENGAFLSARNFAPVNWASRIDEKGRPVENPAARYDETGRPFAGWPSARGAHSWQPMAFNPETGLVYIPVQETAQIFEFDAAYRPERMGWHLGALLYPKTRRPLPPARAYLLAWDPVAQKERWRAPLSASGGGVLSTAGNLVFQGDGEGKLVAYRADNGKRLWSAALQGQAMAAPISYAVGGEQFIAIMVGCGGDFADQCRLVGPDGRKPIADRLQIFRLGGTARLPAPADRLPLTVTPPEHRPPQALVARGDRLFERYCAVCHGGSAISAGLNPDLRASLIVPTDLFYDVVLKGALKANGMADFGPVLSRDDARAIQAYIADRRAQTASPGTATP